jgi:hypothetical protein
MLNDRIISIRFISPKVKQRFNELSKENPILYKFINRALDDIRNNPLGAIHIKEKQIPKYYKDLGYTKSVYKYDLPNGWRLIYYIKGSKVEILNIIIEWFSHDEYSKRFNYK